MITRRNLITTSIALAVGATVTAPAAETGPRMVRIDYTWPDGTVSTTRVPASSLAHEPRPVRIVQPLLAQDGGGVLIGREVVQ